MSGCLFNIFKTLHKIYFSLFFSCQKPRFNVYQRNFKRFSKVWFFPYYYLIGFIASYSVFNFYYIFTKILSKGGSQGLISDAVEWILTFSGPKRSLNFNILRFFSMG